MRLLESRTLKFREFFQEDSTPAYAILSHTWEGDEVSFDDMQRNRTVAESKAGFRKIKWCAKQAIADGLDYIWVDTCCIDKSSSAELSEAINSMFRWYKKSRVCYAYLYDVPVTEEDYHGFKFQPELDENFELLDKAPRSDDLKTEDPAVTSDDVSLFGPRGGVTSVVDAEVQILIEDEVLASMRDEVPGFMRDEPAFMRAEQASMRDEPVFVRKEVSLLLEDEVPAFSPEFLMTGNIFETSEEPWDEPKVAPSDWDARSTPPEFFRSIFQQRFANSRWFRRGWTLQELIAPGEVLFFTRNWVLIGEKRMDWLAEIIKKCSGIPVKVLSYGEISGYSVAQRMSWAAFRSTTRVEDIAYCLMGLFDIYMPMLYGEGNRAFIRLQEEIIKQSNDMSILCWSDPRASFCTYRGILARTPFEFAKCRDMVWDQYDTSPGPEVTSRGTKLNDVVLKPHPIIPENYMLFVPGVRDIKSGHRLGIRLQRISQTQYARVDPDRVEIYREHLLPARPNIFIRPRPIVPDCRISRLGGVRVLNGEKELYDIVPLSRWDPKRNFFSFQRVGQARTNPLIQFSVRIQDTNIPIVLDTTKELQFCISIYDRQDLEAQHRWDRLFNTEFLTRFNIIHKYRSVLWIDISWRLEGDDFVWQLTLDTGGPDIQRIRERAGASNIRNLRERLEDLRI